MNTSPGLFLGTKEQMACTTVTTSCQRQRQPQAMARIQTQQQGEDKELQQTAMDVCVIEEGTSPNASSFEEVQSTSDAIFSSGENFEDVYVLDSPRRLADPGSAAAARPTTKPASVSSSSLLGAGTYGVVRRYRHCASSSLVAVKTIDVDRMDEREEKKKTKPRGTKASSQEQQPPPPTIVNDYQLLEMVCAKALSHANLLQALDVFQEPRRTHLVFPLADVSLRHWPFSAARRPAFTRIFHQILDGLAFLHDRGLVHRDVKPDNILLFNVLRGGDVGCLGEDVQARLGDWSVCRPSLAARHKVGLSSTEAFTRWYRPVELLLGSELYDGGADVWALGIAMVHTYGHSTSEYFCQDTDDEVLLDIFRQLGFPHEKSWPGVTRLKYFRKAETLASRALKAPLRSQPDSGFTTRLAARMGPHGIELLLAMLTLNPAARVTAHAARAHRYFRSLLSQPTPTATTIATAEGHVVPRPSSSSCCSSDEKSVTATPPPPPLMTCCDSPSPLPLSLVFTTMQHSFDVYGAGRGPRTTVVATPSCGGGLANDDGPTTTTTTDEPPSLMTTTAISEERGKAVVVVVEEEQKKRTAAVPPPPFLSPQQACLANGIALSLVAEMWAVYTLRRPTPTEDRAELVLHAMVQLAWDWYFDWHGGDARVVCKAQPGIGDLQRKILETLCFDLVNVHTVFTTTLRLLPNMSQLPNEQTQCLQILLLLASYSRFLPSGSSMDLDNTVQLCHQLALRASLLLAGDPPPPPPSLLATEATDVLMLCTTWHRGLLIARQRIPQLLFCAKPATLDMLVHVLATTTAVAARGKRGGTYAPPLILRRRRLQKLSASSTTRNVRAHPWLSSSRTVC